LHAHGGRFPYSCIRVFSTTRATEQHPKVQTGRRQGDWMVGTTLNAIRENEKVRLLA
jgi:hypothetical protein